MNQQQVFTSNNILIHMLIHSSFIYQTMLSLYINENAVIGKNLAQLNEDIRYNNEICQYLRRQSSNAKDVIGYFKANNFSIK